ncbi:MAG: dolichyl-phosphate beta-glucosyltransferase [Aggregatilineales bacterium]
MSSSAPTTGNHPFVSIIIPALNEERRLSNSLKVIDAFLSTQPYTAEVIVVENGSTDDTVGVVKRFAQNHPYVKLYAGEPRGKGRAVRRGMLAACGEYRFICDADLSMPIEELAKFLPPELDHYDVAIGSREGPNAHRYGEPLHRHLIGRIANFLIKLLAVRGFEDTQCGFKSFSRAAAEDLFSVQRMNGIGFDVEALYIAQKRGYRIVEVPIDWYYNSESKMRLFQDSLGIIGEMLEIRRNWKTGLYTRRIP